jgi:hypothetical protein
MAIDDVTKITETITWRDITEGCKIEAAGNSRLFNTGVPPPLPAAAYPPLLLYFPLRQAVRLSPTR